ncbi:hypothetical protein GCM10011344_07990 [Dokdonia pacifica]|uniref:AraC family transcriptional regulator n=1 Tax=Dokdonia pacifica TaxID=1627892 RepID=UPI000B7756BF|nr:AraC family transcriptional regulator [Dokdonia pacifica]GGG09766.1 hypothetical protein GCM10011344_07990 [Dokdonia pacifica]
MIIVHALVKNIHFIVICFISKPSKQIATNLGYDDEFYFSGFFKKKVGVSPDNYRKTVDFVKLEEL